MLVLDYLKDRFELSGQNPEIYWSAQVIPKELPEGEYNVIIKNLIKDGVLEKPFQFPVYTTEELWDYAYISNKEKFYDFCSKVTNRTKQLKSGEKLEKNDKKTKGVSFNDSGVLMIGDYSIDIDLKNKQSFAHRVLAFLKKEGFEKEAYYIDIAKEMDDAYEEESRYYKDKYYLNVYRACKDIQEKIQQQTKFTIEDFLGFNSSQDGSVKINSKYL